MTLEIVLLCVAALTAGFIDAVAGGGGLIQVPAALILLPQYPVVNVIGTLKIPSSFGTSIATVQYARSVKLNYLHIGIMTAVGFAAAFAGSKTLTLVSNTFIKPFLLVMLIGVAIYTFTNKNFGKRSVKTHTEQQQLWYCVAIGAVLGFYEGFLGPGSGVFMILSFVGLLGFDILKASAHSKFLNFAANVGAIVFFALSGKIIYAVALPMAVCNGLGGWIGARMAILRGNAFIRIVFLIVVCGTLIRLAYDVFRH